MQYRKIALNLAGLCLIWGPIYWLSETVLLIPPSPGHYFTYVLYDCLVNMVFGVEFPQSSSQILDVKVLRGNLMGSLGVTPHAVGNNTILARRWWVRDDNLKLLSINCD